LFKKLFCLIAILIICFASLNPESKNILDLKGSKIYFSIVSHINYDYYTSDYKKYSDILKNFYIDTLTKDDPKKLYHTPIEISLPDSLVAGYFEIKEGFSAILIDSVDFHYFEIKDFKTTTSIEGSGKSRVLFSVPDSIVFNRKKLFLISEDRSAFGKLRSCISNNNTDLNVMINVYRKIADFFYHNRDILDRQMVNITPISDTLSYDQFEKEIFNNFILKIFHLDSGGYYLEGTCNKYIYNKFFAVISDDFEKITFNQHMRFYQAFKHENDYYFFCHAYLPNTGANVYYVFKLVDQELIPIFIDGSYSM